VYTSNVLESNLLEVTAHAELLAVIADPLRLTVIHRLAREGTRCVCDLQPEPPIPDNQLSYHLRVLRDAGLVTAARRGRWMDYTLANDALDRLHAALPQRELAEAI
jgi:ArsR family transcriptional regulator